MAMDKGMVEVLGRLALSATSAIVEWFTASADKKRQLLEQVKVDTKRTLDYMEDFERRADAVLSREINEASEKPSRTGEPVPPQTPPDEPTKP